jgi:3-oxoacyl-[acyl-carrier-protein] synthase-3
MPTTIDGITVTKGRRVLRAPSGLRLAVKAGRGALSSTGRTPGDTDLLLNAGIYHERQIGEPAIAALIQDDLGANTGDVSLDHRTTFSFDVVNGACGVLSSIQIADGFLTTHTIETALVVASDVSPGRKLSPDFPYSPAGGALVCGWTDDDTRGLGTIRWHDSPDGGASYHSEGEYPNGRNIIAIHEDASFAEKAGAAAATAAEEVLAEDKLSSDDIDLFIASPGVPKFTQVLIDRLGDIGERLISAEETLHTVGFVEALEQAVSTGRWASAKTVLFVCGAAGVTGGAAIYRP